jgi:hypothetical protein
MIDYVVKLTKDATQVWKDDHEKLRAAGFPPHAQRVGHAINVVEPGCNQRDLQDGLILEAREP